jgi:hypothetical protein
LFYVKEFAEFIHKVTAESLCPTCFKLIVTLVSTPALPPATKWATESVPRVVKMAPTDVSKNSTYAKVLLQSLTPDPSPFF